MVGEDCTSLGSFSSPVTSNGYQVQAGFIARINATSHQWDWAEWPAYSPQYGYNYTRYMTSISISSNGDIGVIGLLNADQYGREYVFGNLPSRAYFAEKPKTAFIQLHSLDR